MLGKAEMRQLTAALSALLLGLAFYLLMRPAESVYLFSGLSVLPGHHLALLGKAGQWLPSAIHAYVFILLTVVAVGNGPRVIYASALLWLSIGWLFEWGQYPAVAEQVLEIIPEWFSQVPILENSRNYFQNGSFDYLDLLATFLGALAALLTYQLTINKQGAAV